MELWIDKAAGNVPEQQTPPDVNELSYLDAYTVQARPTGPSADYFNGQAAAIRGLPTDTQAIGKAQIESQVYDPREAAYADYLLSKKTQLALDIQTTINGQTYSMAQLDAIAEQQRKLDEEQTDVASRELAAVKGYAPNGEELKQKEMAFQLLAANDVAQMAEEQGWLSKTGDVLGMFVPVADYKDTAIDVPNTVSSNPDLAAIHGDSLQDIILKFHGLSPENKMNLWPKLRDAVLEATGSWVSDSNQIRARDILTQMLQPGETAVQSGANKMLAVDIATTIPFTKIGKGIASLSKLGLKSASTKAVKEAVDTLYRSSNAVKVAAEAGDTAAAAGINHAAIKDAGIAAATNVNQTAAVLNAYPVNVANWVKGAVDGLSPEEQVLFNADISTIQGFTRSMTSETDLIQIGALTQSSRKYQIDSLFKKLEGAREDYLLEGWAVDNMRVVKETQDGFEWAYDLKKVTPADAKPRYKFNYETGKPEPIPNEANKTVTGQDFWKIDSVTGTYTQTGKSLETVSGSTGGLSPAAWSVGGNEMDFGRAVMENAAAINLSGGMQAQFTKMFQWAGESIRGPLKLAGRGRVDKVLMYGDEFINPGTQIKGRTFTKQELADGFVIGGKTVRLTHPDEVQAYYRMRMVADGMWEVQNQVLRREKLLAGFKQAVIGDGDDAINMAVKPYSTAGYAKASLAKRPGYGVYDPATGRIDDLTSETIEAEYQKGRVLARIDHDWSPKGDFAPGSEHVEYIWVKNGEIRDLAHQVLPYKDGYVPKINDAQYAVKMTTPIYKRGVNNPRPASVALRLFNSKKDADEFRMAVATEYANKHGVTLEEALMHYPDPEHISNMVPMERMEGAVAGHNGLFTGTRSADDILFGMAGTKPERIGTLDSFKRYANHLSSVVPRNELRIRNEQEWLNTVKEMLPSWRVAGFESTGLPSGATGNALATMRRQIKEWNMMPTAQESLFQASIQYSHDWLLHGVNKVGSRLGFQSKDSIKSLLWLKHADPIAAAKAATTHSTMGMFNPLQIPLQASAAMIALSRRWPVHLTTNTLTDIGHAFRFAMLDNIRHEGALSKVLKVLVDGGEIDSRVADAYRAWTRTGMYESTMSSLEGGILATDGLGVAFDTLKKVGDFGMIPYKAGDRFARRVAWIKEYAYWASKNPGKVATDDDILAIMKEADKDLLEMNAAHRAVWQGGKGTGALREIAGLATQYMQVGTKMMELLLKPVGRGGFTKAEVARIMYFQAGLFGAAGVPIFSLYAPQLMKALGVENMDRRTAMAVNQGSIGLITQALFGTDIDISQRVSIGSQLNNMVIDWLTSDDPIIVRALGPFGSATGSRVVDAIRELDILFSGSRAGERDLTTGDLKMALTSIAGLASSTRNATKAYIMNRANVILDKHGNIVIGPKDFTPAEELATALGLRLTEESNVRFMAMDMKTEGEIVSDLADIRTKLMYNALFVHKLDEAQVDNVRKQIQFMDEITDTYIADKVTSRVNDKLWNSPVSLEDKTIKHWYDRVAPERWGAEAVYDSYGVTGMSAPVVVPFSQQLRDEENK